jgi:tRNA uridine 5-carbamoylmethylation protein Kti12
MAKPLTKKQKEQIREDWKTGVYRSYTELGRKHKRDHSTIRRLVKDLPKTNIDIVEAGIIYERSKDTLRTPIAKKAVDYAVALAITEDKIHMAVVQATNENIKRISKLLSKKKKDLSMQDLKAAQEALDKALFTIGKAERHAPRPTASQEEGLIIEHTSPQQITEAVAQALPD